MISHSVEKNVTVTKMLFSPSNFRANALILKHLETFCDLWTMSHTKMRCKKLFSTLAAFRRTLILLQVGIQ